MDSYVYIITALLPLTAMMTVFQVNPYHALIIRGVLGAIAALTYTVLGAADVALTEALVGTLLAITLYAVAVRSSLVLRLGVLKEDDTADFKQIVAEVRSTFRKHHMQVELVPFTDSEALHQALIDKEIHATCYQDSLSYNTTSRLRRLYEIMHSELDLSLTRLSYESEVKE